MRKMICTRPTRVLISLAVLGTCTTVAWSGEAEHSGAAARLALEAADCQDDAFPGEAGFQIEVTLSMYDLPQVTTGFQAFLEFDNVIIAYRGDLSSYNDPPSVPDDPFPLHMQDLLTAEVAPGELRLDGSVNFTGDPGTMDDSLLATLVFDVDVECSSTILAFDLGQPFPSELSFEGDPIPTDLEDTNPFTLDDTNPTVMVPDPVDLECSSDLPPAATTIAEFLALPGADADDNCTAQANLQLDSYTEGVFVGDECYGRISRTYTITDDCGNSNYVIQVFPISDDTAPTATQGSIAACFPTAPEAEAAAIAATTDLADNCTAAANLLVSADTVGDCSATVTVTIEDECGNTITFDYPTRIDNTAPTATQSSIAACYPTVAEAESAAIAATTDLADNCTATGNLLVSANTVGDCNATVTVTIEDECGNTSTFDYATCLDADGDGVCNGDDNCPDTPPFVIVDPFGCPIMCSEQADADIVIMIDITGSINASDLANEKDGARTILDLFSDADPKPRVAIGTFNGPCSSCPPTQARILAGLTDAYGNPGIPSGLYAVIDGITVGPSNGYTDLGAAIEVAQTELPAVENPASYMIVMSDGVPNYPDDVCAIPFCNCASADAAATAAADAAKAAGTGVFTIHIEGHGLSCPGEPAAGMAFMEVLSSGPGYSYLGSGDLSGIFTQIAEVISCDDGDPYTLEECCDGFCVHTLGNDCNSNGSTDECDIAGGTSLDCNGNAVPDECEYVPGTGCPGDILLADMNCDGATNGGDIQRFVDTLVAGGYTCQADMDQNGIVDFADVPLFVSALLAP